MRRWHDDNADAIAQAREYTRRTGLRPPPLDTIMYYYGSDVDQLGIAQARLHEVQQSIWDGRAAQRARKGRLVCSDDQTVFWRVTHMSEAARIIPELAPYAHQTVAEWSGGKWQRRSRERTCVHDTDSVVRL